MSFYVNAITRGNNILLREINDDGEEFRDKIPFEPELYISAGEADTPWRSIHGDKLKPKFFDSIYDAKDFIKRYKDTEFQMYGMDRWNHQFLVDKYHDIKYDASKIKVRFIDIEVLSKDVFPEPQKAEWPINAISYYDTDTKRFITLGLTNPDGQRWLDEDSDYETEYHQFSTERELLMFFLDHWETAYPHIVSGWNSAGFDIPYIVNRINNLLGDRHTKRLSPWGIINESQGKDNYYNDIIRYDILGVSHVDYLDAYKKFTFENQEFYKLDHIGWVELGIRKIDYSEYGSLYNLYNMNYQKFIDYNILDVDIMRQLDKKLNLMSIIIDIAFKAKINFEETFSPVKTWDNIIYEHLFKNKNQIIPIKKGGSKAGGFAGGYVKDPIRGVYDWVVSFDLASLYPSIIRQWNIGPDTLHNYDNYDPTGAYIRPVLESEHEVKTNKTVAVNGVEFDNDQQSFLSELMENLYNERKQAKGLMQESISEGDMAGKALWKTRQMVLKVLLNSLYGALGNQYFRFFDIKLATAVTISGQLVIQWAGKYVNKYLNDLLKTDNEEYVIYTDTDSIYVNMGPFVDKLYKDKSDTKGIVNFLDKSCEAIKKMCIDPSYEKLQEYLNCREQTMIMDREVIGSGIFVQKKRYAIAMHDNEGERFENQKLKVMGLETAKKDTPEICRNALSDCLKSLLVERNNDLLLDYIDKFWIEYMAAPVMDIAQVKGVSFVDKYTDPSGWYIKGTPANSKAAINYNRFIQGKSNDIIKNGDKIRMVQLIMPNPVKDSIIGFVDEIPPGIEEYVNRREMFHSHFLKPLSNIVHTIGWKTERQSSLDDFF